MIDPTRLLDGPRGRQMLLQYALESSLALDPDYALQHAVAHASHDLDRGRGTSRVSIGFGSNASTRPSATPETVRELLLSSPLLEVTQSNLRKALAAAVERAMYWQEPDGEDVLMAMPPVKDALLRVAEHLTKSQCTNWWDNDPKLDDQWMIIWRPIHFEPTLSVTDTLRSWQQDTRAWEDRAKEERPTDVPGNGTFIWWSIPPSDVKRSSRSLFDGCPAGLWFVEDGFREASATTVPLHVPTSVNIFEVTGAKAWADLCREYPMDVSDRNRNDWYRTTGRVGRWVIPDWSQVAQEYDGVHLSAAAYLAAAGTAIHVDDVTASVIAGWNPDETWWFTDDISIGKSATWIRKVTQEGDGWSLK